VGTGKTFLTSAVIHEMTSTIQEDPGTSPFITEDKALAYFYFQKGDKSLNYDAVIRCLVKQLAFPATNEEAIHADILAEYNDKQSHGNRKTPFDCGKAIDLIEKLVASRSRVILVIDAVDECDQSSREELLDTFYDLMNKISYLWIFVSSRPYRDILDQLPPSPCQAWRRR
jgi:hypothetical protein